MANEKFSQFNNRSGSQAAADYAVGITPSLAAALQNSLWTFDSLFSYPLQAVTDEAARYATAGGAPGLSLATEAAFYFDGTRFQVSYNGGAYSSLLEGTPGAANRVPFFITGGSLSSAADLQFNPTTFTLKLGDGANNGSLSLNGLNGNVTNVSVQNPSANRTLYLPDSNSPTAGNMLYVSTFGATIQTAWTTGLTWDTAGISLSITGTANASIGYNVIQNNTGTLAEAALILLTTRAAVLSQTSQGYTTAGLRVANQIYLRGGAGDTRMLFELAEAAGVMQWGFNAVEVARLSATGLSMTASGATAAAPSTLVDIQTGVAADSGLRLRNIGSTPTASTVYLGVDVNGKVVVAAAPGSGGGSIGGSIAATQIAFGDAVANDIAGEANFIWDTATKLQTITHDSVSSNIESALTLVNTSVAAAGTQQNSPSIFLTGQGWKTSAGGASQETTVALTMQPVQGGTVPTSNLLIGFRANAGAFTTRATLSSIGRLTIDEGLIAVGGTFSGGVTAAGGAFVAGASAAATGSLMMYNAGGITTTTIAAGNAASSLTFILPVVDPTAGQVLSGSAPSGGNVTLTWVTGTAALTQNQIGFGSGANVLSGSTELTYGDVAAGFVYLNKSQDAPNAFRVRNANTGTAASAQFIANSDTASVGLIAHSAAHSSFANTILLTAQSTVFSLRQETAASIINFIVSTTEYARIDNTSGLSLTSPSGTSPFGLRSLSLNSSAAYTASETKWLAVNATGYVVIGENPARLPTRSTTGTTPTALNCDTDGAVYISTEAGATAFTLTNPTARQRNLFWIQKNTTDGNNLTLTPSSGNINNAASFTFNGTLGSAGQGFWVSFDGTNWWII
jgi:hypothetical protein